MNSNESPRPAGASTESRDRGGVAELQQHLDDATIVYQDGIGALTELKAQPDPATRLDEVKCSVTLRELQSLKVKVRKLAPSAGTHVVPTEQATQVTDSTATNIRTEVQRALEAAVLEENKRMLILQQVISDRDGFFGTRAQTIVYTEADLIPLTEEDSISDYTVLISKILEALGTDPQVSPETKSKVCEDYRLSQATCQLMIDNRSLYSSDATARITNARSRAQAESDLAREKEKQSGGAIEVEEEPLDPEAIEEASEDIEGKIQGYREQARETLTTKRKGVVATLGQTISSQVALSATGVKVEIFSDYGNRSIEDSADSQLVVVLQNAIEDAQEDKTKALAMSGLVNVRGIVRKYQTGMEYPALLGKVATSVADKTKSSSLHDHLERNRRQAIEEMRVAIAIQNDVVVDDVTPEEATSVLNDPDEVIALGNALARLGENIAGARSLRHPLRGGPSLVDEKIAQLQLLKLHVEKCGAWAGELHSAIQGYDQRLAALDLGEQSSEQAVSNELHEEPQSQNDTEEVLGDIHDSVIDGSNIEKDFNGAHFGTQHGEPDAVPQAQSHVSDTEEVLGDIHDSVISGESAKIDADGTHFGEQPGDPEENPPPTYSEGKPVEVIRETSELTHPGFERLEPPHTQNFEAHEGTPIEEWKEEGLQVGDRSVSWGIHPVADQIMPRMWVYDLAAGGNAQGEALDIDGNKNVFEHGDFALVAIAQPAGSEPNRTWNIRAELLKRIPPPPDITTRINNINERLMLLNDTPPEQMDIANLLSMQEECNAILEQYEEHAEDGNISAEQAEQQAKQIENIRSLSSLIGNYIRTLQEKESRQPIQLDADKLAHLQNLDAAMQNASRFSPNLVAARNAERAGNIDEALNLYRQELSRMRLLEDEQRSLSQPPTPGQAERIDLIERDIRRILEPGRDANIQALHAETERLSTGFQEAYTRDPTSAIDTFMRDVNSIIIPAIQAIHQVNTELGDNLFTRLNIDISHLFERVNLVLIQNHDQRILEIIDTELGLLNELRRDTIQPEAIDEMIRETKANRANAVDLLNPFEVETVDNSTIKAALALVEDRRGGDDRRAYAQALEELAKVLTVSDSRNNRMRALGVYEEAAGVYNRTQDTTNASRLLIERARLEAELFPQLPVLAAGTPPGSPVPPRVEGGAQQPPSEPPEPGDRAPDGDGNKTPVESLPLNPTEIKIGEPNIITVTAGGSLTLPLNGSPVLSITFNDDVSDFNIWADKKDEPQLIMAYIDKRSLIPHMHTQNSNNINRRLGLDGYTVSDVVVIDRNAESHKPEKISFTLTLSKRGVTPKPETIVDTTPQIIDYEAIAKRKIAEAVVALPIGSDVKRKIQGPLEQLYGLAGRGINLELDFVREAERIAQEINIPYLSNAVKAMAELIQAAVSARDAETGEMTPESLHIMRGHLVNWLAADLRGMVDLAELAGVPEIAALSSVIQAGSVDRNALAVAVVQPLLRRLRAQHTDNRAVSAVCDILEGLLSESGDQGMLNQVAIELAKNEYFSAFVDKLRQYIRPKVEPVDATISSQKPADASRATPLELDLPVSEGRKTSEELQQELSDLEGRGNSVSRALKPPDYARIVELYDELNVIPNSKQMVFYATHIGNLRAEGRTDDLIKVLDRYCDVLRETNSPPDTERTALDLLIENVVKVNDEDKLVSAYKKMLDFISRKATVLNHFTIMGITSSMEQSIFRNPGNVRLFDVAYTILDKAIAELRSRGDAYNIAVVLETQGSILRTSGYYQEAFNAYLDAKTNYEQSNAENKAKCVADCDTAMQAIQEQDSSIS